MKSPVPKPFDPAPLHVDAHGYYGQFGGSFVAGELAGNLEKLDRAYREAMADPDFLREFRGLLRDYVGRPTPLYHATRLSDTYGTNIYLKREDLCHTGAHKINNAIGCGLLARRMGKTRVLAETGAGQHGVATATACALLGLECVIYMGATDVERQRPNVERMRMLGAKVVPVSQGEATLKDAVNAALEAWAADPEAFYMLGSAVGPHPYPEIVATFQSVISEEIKEQLREAEGRENPDCVIAALGGGSNAAGAFFHFIDSPSVRLIGAEAAGKGVDSGQTAASLTAGEPAVLHGSRTMVLLDGEGECADAYSISAGLDYPGIGPLHAWLASTGREEIVAVTDSEALDAAFRLARVEGILPALESAHALAVLNKMRFSAADIVVINLSGRGDKDMATYLEAFHI